MARIQEIISIKGQRQKQADIEIALICLVKEYSFSLEVLKRGLSSKPISLYHHEPTFHCHHTTNWYNPRIKTHRELLPNHIRPDKPKKPISTRQNRVMIYRLSECTRLVYQIVFSIVSWMILRLC